MVTDIQVFNFQDKEVRTENKDGEAWFCLADVCKILDLDDTSKVIKRLSEDGVNTGGVINIGDIYQDISKPVTVCVDSVGSLFVAKYEKINADPLDSRNYAPGVKFHYCDEPQLKNTLRLRRFLDQYAPKTEQTKTREV